MIRQLFIRLAVQRTLNRCPASGAGFEHVERRAVLLGPGAQGIGSGRELLGNRIPEGGGWFQGVKLSLLVLDPGAQGVGGGGREKEGVRSGFHGIKG